MPIIALLFGCGAEKGRIRSGSFAQATGCDTIYFTARHRRAISASSIMTTTTTSIIVRQTTAEKGIGTVSRVCYPIQQKWSARVADAAAVTFLPFETDFRSCERHQPKKKKKVKRKFFFSFAYIFFFNSRILPLPLQGREKENEKKVAQTSRRVLGILRAKAAYNRVLWSLGFSALPALRYCCVSKSAHSTTLHTHIHGP